MTTRLFSLGVFSLGAAAALTLLVAGSGQALAEADFSGKWVPAGGSPELQAADLPLTAQAKEKLAQFDPRQHDSTLFCLPYGTPRNILATAPYPIEILQRPERLTMIFDRLGDVRRIHTDGRAPDDNAWPTWLGQSAGRWEGETLVIESILFLTESVLSDAGLPHSEEMTVSERLSLVMQDGEEMLRDEITITDPVMYETPITAVRLFRRAPHAQMSEGSGLCLLDQWRQQLVQRNQDLREQTRSGNGDLQ